jgi:hypothetical protein
MMTFRSNSHEVLAKDRREAFEIADEVAAKELKNMTDSTLVDNYVEEVK